MIVCICITCKYLMHVFQWLRTQMLVTEKVVEEESAGSDKSRKKASRWARSGMRHGTSKRVVKTVQRKKIITMPKTKSAYLLVYDRKDLRTTTATTVASAASALNKEEDKFSPSSKPPRPEEPSPTELPVRFRRALWEHSASFLMDKMLFEHSHARKSEAAEVMLAIESVLLMYVCSSELWCLLLQCLCGDCLTLTAVTTNPRETSK